MNTQTQLTRGFALILLLFLGTAFIAGAGTLAKVAALQTQSECERQAWHRGRLVALGGVEYVRWLLGQNQAVSVAKLTLPVAAMSPQEAEAIKAQMTAAVFDVLPLPEDMALWLAYDPTTHQALAYCEVYVFKQCQSRICVKKII